MILLFFNWYCAATTGGAQETAAAAVQADEGGPGDASSAPARFPQVDAQQPAQPLPAEIWSTLKTRNGNHEVASKSDRSRQAL